MSSYAEAKAAVLAGKFACRQGWIGTKYIGLYPEGSTQIWVFGWDTTPMELWEPSGGDEAANNYDIGPDQPPVKP